MSRDSDESRLTSVVAGALKRWLDKARDAVLNPWREHRLPPSATPIRALAGQWRPEMDTILTEIGKISMAAWSRAANVPPVSRHSMVMASLAAVENYLVAIPDRVYHMVFVAIADGVNGGKTVDQIAADVDGILSWTGSPNWPGRARNIAVTEVTRAYGAGTLAAGMEQSRVAGRLLRKQWVNEGDSHVRPAHQEAGGQIRPLGEPFNVGMSLLMFPGDPLAPVDEVAGCRCDIVIINEEGGRRG